MLSESSPSTADRKQFSGLTPPGSIVHSCYKHCRGMFLKIQADIYFEACRFALMFGRPKIRICIVSELMDQLASGFQDDCGNIEILMMQMAKYMPRCLFLKSLLWFCVEFVL